MGCIIFSNIPRVPFKRTCFSFFKRQEQPHHNTSLIFKNCIKSRNLASLSYRRYSSQIIFKRLFAMFEVLTFKHRRCQIEKWSGHSSENIWATPPVKAPSVPPFLTATVPQATNVRDLGVPLGTTFTTSAHCREAANTAR